MSPERSNAYRRVMKTLEDMGPSKLLEAEQQRIRYAADNLIFAGELSSDIEAQEALADVEALCAALVQSGRWEQVSAGRLAADVYECGPAAPVVLQAA
jgi:aminoglycoside phosphotransferase